MLENMLIPPTLFFALGLISRLVRSDLKFPGDVGKAASIYLLVGIGLHGGMEMAKAQWADAAASVVAAIILGILLPLIAFTILRFLGRIDRLNAAAVAAHYGSVSAGTFLTAIAFLDTKQIPYETFPRGAHEARASIEGDRIGHRDPSPQEAGLRQGSRPA